MKSLGALHGESKVGHKWKPITLCSRKHQILAIEKRPSCTRHENPIAFSGTLMLVKLEAQKPASTSTEYVTWSKAQSVVHLLFITSGGP